jgi:hypothetical protein
MQAHSMDGQIGAFHFVARERHVDAELVAAAWPAVESNILHGVRTSRRFVDQEGVSQVPKAGLYVINDRRS